MFDALAVDDASMRLQAAMAAGTRPDPGYLEALVGQCAVEPDFFVRDMLTWALTRLPAAGTVERLCAELRSDRAQARSQALHTLSKIADASAWPAITRALLHDADEEVARSAWRAAVVLVPDDDRAALAAELAGEFGRGGRDLRLSLSRALVALGDVIEPVLHAAGAGDDATVRAHADATQRLLDDPDAGFELAVDEAKRVAVTGPDREETHTC